jgi:hypothetical protein
MFAILLTEGMDPFYQNISSFPTVIFTFFLLVCLLYWLVAMLGLVDIDVLDLDASDLDPDFDFSQTNNEMSSPEALAGLMLRFGLVGVPVTVIVSLISLFGWIICYYIVHFLFALLPGGGWLQFLLGVPILVGTLYVAVMITAQAIKPLRPLFRDSLTEGKKYLLGQVAIVRTSRVDSRFGEAVLDDGGAGLILKVRSNDDQQFKHGDRIVLLEYLEEQGAYRVISESEFNNG